MWRTSLCTLALVAVSGCNNPAHMMSPAPSAMAAPASGGILVTAHGFEPATVVATAGVPCTLMVKRVTDMTCAQEFVMDEHGIRRPLPLGEPVPVVFTHLQPGEVRFTCGMGMVSGRVIMK